MIQVRRTKKRRTCPASMDGCDVIKSRSVGNVTPDVTLDSLTLGEEGVSCQGRRKEGGEKNLVLIRKRAKSLSWRLSPGLKPVASLLSCWRNHCRGNRSRRRLDNSVFGRKVDSRPLRRRKEVTTSDVIQTTEAMTAYSSAPTESGQDNEGAERRVFHQ